MSANVHTALTGYLETQLPTARIFAGVNYPGPGYDINTESAVCLRTRGGDVAEERSHLIPSLQFKCYAASPAEAWTLYMALDQALMAPADPLVRYAVLETYGTPFKEPDSGHDFVLAFYQVHIANEE